MIVDGSPGGESSVASADQVSGLGATKEVIFPLGLEATEKGRSFQVEETTDARH